MVGGVTLVGGNGSELARLPGGAELNILPANGEYDHTIRVVLVSWLFLLGVCASFLRVLSRIRCCDTVPFGKQLDTFIIL